MNEWSADGNMMRKARFGLACAQRVGRSQGQGSGSRLVQAPRPAWLVWLVWLVWLALVASFALPSLQPASRCRTAGGLQASSEP
jgi:hypothetical protein